MNVAYLTETIIVIDQNTIDPQPSAGVEWTAWRSAVKTVQGIQRGRADVAEDQPSATQRCAASAVCMAGFLSAW